MHVIRARNVADALPMGILYLLRNGARENSRAGPVLVAPTPVTTIYERPTERVLHAAVRDANPFFHLAESLWMLAGRNDAALLDNFVSDFGARFAESASGDNNREEDGRVHGAYGHRWRRALGFDQLTYAVDMLSRDPASRQCVIQMWDAADRGCRAGECSVRYGWNDLRGVWRDRPCNTHAYLRVRRGDVDHTGDHTENVLDITVCCRSNDAIWGSYGANAVHFSVLQEYLAAAIGVGVGTYYQISNNFHVYESELTRLTRRMPDGAWYLNSLQDDRYRRHETCRPQPIVSDPTSFLEEVDVILASYELVRRGSAPGNAALACRNSWLGDTVWPALMAHAAWKRNAPYVEHQDWISAIASPDWRAACGEWIDRRVQARTRRENASAE